ncbi:MAG: hypothetical protein MJZ42_00345 [Bacteroidales bacterium]|nr:hypothetical protein [Bacteroidales bacterium]
MKGLFRILDEIISTEKLIQQHYPNYHKDFYIGDRDSERNPVGFRNGQK